ncbi:MAG: helix-turn-helix transcriptional regulator [Clostridia bacterium]|nr:helix-turn-helix transcriptional regulator [Clostridia bacterium]
MKKSFAENLSRLRKDRDWSQAEVAAKVFVSQQCVSQWENGLIEPTLTFLWRLADLFDVSIDELIGRKDY